MYLRLRGRFSRGRLRIFRASRNFHHTPDLRSNFIQNPDKTLKTLEELITDAHNVEHELNLGGTPASWQKADHSSSEPDSADNQTYSLNKPEETSESLYSQNQHVHSHKPLHLFTTNSSLKGQNTPNSKAPETHKTKLSQLIYGIFQDSADLAHNIDVGEQTSINYSSLSDSLREKVNNQLDTYNKFVLLLNQHPLAVPPLLLLSLYSLIPSILPSDRQALLRTLVFHQEWTHFWNVAFVNTPTLADVEEITDLIYTEATACMYEDLAVWQALLAAHEEIDNPRLFRAFCESISYKFGIEASKALEFCNSDIQSHNSFSLNSAALPAQRAFKAAEYLGSLNQETVEFKELRSYLLKNDDLFKVRGFVSKLLQLVSHPCLINFVIKRPRLRLNELDLFQLWQHSSPETEQHLTIHLFRELKRNTRISNSVKNSISACVKDKDLKLSLADKLHSALSQEMINDLFPMLIGSEAGRRLLKKIRRNRFGIFETAAAMYIEKVQKQIGESNLHPNSDIYKSSGARKCFVSDEGNLKASNTETENATDILGLLIWILNESSHNSLLASEILATLDGTKANIDAIMKLKLTLGGLMELWKFSLEHELLDESSAIHLFEDILRKTWDFKEMARRDKQTGNNEELEDFQQCFKNASFREQKKLSHHLSSIALTLSMCKAEYAAYIINTIYMALLASGETNTLISPKPAESQNAPSVQPPKSLIVTAGLVTESTHLEKMSAPSPNRHTDTRTECTTVSCSTAEFAEFAEIAEIAKSSHSLTRTHSIENESKKGYAYSHVKFREVTGYCRSKKSNTPADKKDMPSTTFKLKSHNPRLAGFAHNNGTHEPVPPYRLCQQDTALQELGTQSQQLSKLSFPNYSDSIRASDGDIDSNCRVVSGCGAEITRAASQDSRLVGPLEPQFTSKNCLPKATGIDAAVTIDTVNADGVTKPIIMDRASNERQNTNCSKSETQSAAKLDAKLDAGYLNNRFDSIPVNDDTSQKMDFHLQFNGGPPTSNPVFLRRKWRQELQTKNENLKEKNSEKLSSESPSIEPTRVENSDTNDSSLKENQEFPNTQNLLETKLPLFTLFTSLSGRHYIVLKLIKYTMQHIFEKQPDTKGIRHMGDILKRLLFDSRTGQAAVFEYMVMHQPAVAFKILHNYETNKPFLVRPLMNAVEQGILRLDRLTLEEKLQYYEKFQGLKTQLRYSAQPSRRTVTMWGELAMQQARGDGEKTREIFSKALKKKIPLRVIRSWTFIK